MLKLNQVAIDLPGGPYFVRELSARASLNLAKALQAANGDIEQQLIAQLTAYVCDESGVPKLTQEAASAILDHPQSVVRALLVAGSQLNGSDADLETRKGN